MLLDHQQWMSDQQKQHERDGQHWLEGQKLTHRASGMAGCLPAESPTPSSPWLPESPKASCDMAPHFSQGHAGLGSADAAVSQQGSSIAAIIRGGSCVSGLLNAGADSTFLGSLAAGDGVHVLEKLVAERLGLAPTEEGKQMLHYVIPQVGPDT